MDGGARGWILWVALAVMCSEAVVSLFPVLREFLVSIRQPSRRLLRRYGMKLDVKEDDTVEDSETESEDRLVPIKCILYGGTVTVVLGTGLVWVIFGSSGIKPWATILAFAISSVLSLLG